MQKSDIQFFGGPLGAKGLTHNSEDVFQITGHAVCFIRDRYKKY